MRSSTVAAVASARISGLSSSCAAIAEKSSSAAIWDSSSWIRSACARFSRRSAAFSLAVRVSVRTRNLRNVRNESFVITARLRRNAGSLASYSAFCRP